MKATGVSSGHLRAPVATPPLAPDEAMHGAVGRVIRLIPPLHCRRCGGTVRGLFAIALLPVRRPVGRRHLHGRDLVFRTIGRPIGEIGRDHIGLRGRVVEGRVDDARRDAIGDQGAQVVSPARLATFTQSPSRTPRCSASCGWISSTSSSMPDDVLGAARLRADIVMAEDAPGREQQRETRPGPLVGRHIFGDR